MDIPIIMLLSGATMVAGFSLYKSVVEIRSLNKAITPTAKIDGDSDREFEIFLALIKTGKLTFESKRDVSHEVEYFLKSDKGEVFGVNLGNAAIRFWNGEKHLRVSFERYGQEFQDLYSQQNQPQQKPKSKLERMLDESLGILTADPDEVVETISAGVLSAKIDSTGEVVSSHANVDWFDEMYQTVNREPVFETKPKISPERQEQKRLLDEQKAILAKEIKWKNLAKSSTYKEYVELVIGGINSGELVAKRFHNTSESVEVSRISNGEMVLRFWLGGEWEDYVLFDVTLLKCNNFETSKQAKTLAKYISENLVSNEAEALEQLKRRIGK